MTLIVGYELPLATYIMYDSKVIEYKRASDDGFPAEIYSELSLDKGDDFSHYRVYSAFDKNGYDTYINIISFLRRVENQYKNRLLLISPLIEILNDIIPDNKNYRALIVANTTVKWGRIIPLPLPTGLRKYKHLLLKRIFNCDYYLIYPTSNIITKFKYNFYALVGFLLCMFNYATICTRNGIYTDSYYKYINNTAKLIATYCVDIIKRVAPEKTGFPMRVFSLYYGTYYDRPFYLEFVHRGEEDGTVVKEHELIS